MFPTTSFAMSKIFRARLRGFMRAPTTYSSRSLQETRDSKACAVAVSGRGAAVKRVNRAVTEWLVASPLRLRECGASRSQTFWPIDEEIQRLNVPFCVHTGAKAGGETRFDSFIICLRSASDGTIIQCRRFDVCRHPEKFPKLRIAFLECGAGWFLLDERMTKMEKRATWKRPLCSKSQRV